MKKFVVLILSFILTFCQGYAIVEDDFVNQTLDKNIKIKPYQPKIVRDDFAESNTKTSTYFKGKYIENFDNPVPVRIKQSLNTKHKLHEGDTVEFELIHDTKIGNTVYPKETTINARIETITYRTRWGVPADITLNNFHINGKQLFGEIYKTGSNRVIWLRPLSLCLMPFCGAGTFLIFVKGGQAKINKNEIFTLYAPD